MKRLASFSAATLTLLLPLSAWAQALGPAAADFQKYCAMCHGQSGRGDGMVGELFVHSPKDLTQLSKENGGTFPFDRVYHSIDGTHRLPAHGLGDNPMPIWGDFLKQEAIEEQGLSPEYAEEVVWGRILGLVYFIQSIQQE